MWEQIIKSLAGDYVYCDLEISALKPKEGIILAEAFVPFNIRFDESFTPIVTIPFYTIVEHWPVPNVETAGYPCNKETMQWHLDKNEAWPHYQEFYLNSNQMNNRIKLLEIEERFKQGSKFISRHSFDSKWLEADRETMFNSIHYRNFMDMATLIPALGFGNAEEYKVAMARAKANALDYQREYAEYTGIDTDALCISHRALSDCLFDIFMIREMLLTYYAQATFKK